MNRKFILATAALVLFLSPLMAGAATSTNSWTPDKLKLGNIPSPEALKEKLTSTTAAVKKAVAGAVARCPVIESKIQVRVSGFDNTKVKHMQVYQNLSNRLSVVADRLAARGLDVAKFKADLAVLDQKIQKFNDDYATYIATLKDSQSSACGKTSSQFKAKLKEAHMALKPVNTDALDIRNYYNTTIKADIAALRAVIKAQAGNSSSSPAAPQAVLPKLEGVTSSAAINTFNLAQ